MWKKNIYSAPRDKILLVRTPLTSYPTIVKYRLLDGVDSWVYCEPVLYDTYECLGDEEVSTAEWIVIPE